MDLYVLLGLERGASTGDIKRAYKRLARKFHPDINPGDGVAAARYRQIADAYETLVDPDRRRRYDTTGWTAPSDGGTTFEFEGFDFSVSVHGAEAPTFGDLFADVLRVRATGTAPDAPERGADLHHELRVGFEAALRGTDRTVSLMRQERCAACHGSGRTSVMESRCPHCQGAGTVRSARGHMVFSKPCPQCGGTGRQRELRCPACGGAQVVTAMESIPVHIPAGIVDGAYVRVPGKGNAGRNGGEPGDLLVRVAVEPHPIFRREGDDLHVVVPIAVHEAALGAKVEVPTPDGPARLRVPPATQSGQRFRLRERGAPSPRDGRRGDLLVEVRLVLPRMLDERSKELMREFGRINGEDVRSDVNR